MDLGNYNNPPEGWVEIREKEFRGKFFQYCSTEEYRQLKYDTNSYTSGLYSSKLYWIEKEKYGLGVALINDWKADKLKFYRIGTKENWKIYTSDFAAQFAGDNS